MTKFNVYADGAFWGQFEADTAKEAMQAAADENGTADIGREHASTEGMTAEPAEFSHPKQPGWTATNWTHKQLMGAGATEIGTAGGYRFYEHPTHGDEAPLLAIRAAQPWCCMVWSTGEFDLPDMT